MPDWLNLVLFFGGLLAALFVLAWIIEELDGP